MSCQRDVPKSCEFKGGVSAHGGRALKSADNGADYSPLPAFTFLHLLPLG
jgi:hypothetical protein